MTVLGFSASRLLGFVVVAASALGAQEGPRPGGRPGTEQWLLWLRDRSFDVRQELRQIRATPGRAQRAGLLAQLDQTAAADQAELAALVTANGGVVLRHYWILSMLAVEVPPAAVPALRAHGRMLRLVPVRSRTAAEVQVKAGGLSSGFAVAPIGVSTDSNNHCVTRARQLLQGASYEGNGGGVRVAVFDSGIDADASGHQSPPAALLLHPAFLEPPVTSQSASRIDVHLRAGTIDCNNILEAGGFNSSAGPWAYRPCRHSSSALHGTAVTGIIAGNADSTHQFVDGHAPHARLVDVSITEPPPSSPIWITNPERDRWTVTDSTMLTAIQLLRSQIIEDDTPVHVLNISFDGWSDPTDPVPTALDMLASEEDILIVSAAGNVPDETRNSNGSYNGLAVGSVHARLSATEPFTPMGTTATGPLNSDWRRYYPDVCATGAGPGDPSVTGPPDNRPRFQYGDAGAHEVQASLLQMPMLDVGDTCSTPGNGNCTTNCAPGTGAFGGTIHSGSIRFAMGTSEAAPQVSGAAALYRAARLATSPPASAEETRAAILLNVLGPFPGSYNGPGSPPIVGTGNDAHAYTGRNTFGVGYVRDDFLAEFAVRDAAIQPLHTVRTLTPSSPTAWVPYGSGGSHGNIDGNKRYAVAICWPRDATDADYPRCIADVDLEVWNSDTTPTVCHARSATPANNYERVTFRPPSVATVYLKITAKSFGDCGNAVPVTIVARQFEPDLDPAASGHQQTPVHATTGVVESLSAGASCTAQAQEFAVTRVVPTAYADAWGSAAVGLTWLNLNPVIGTVPSFQGVGVSSPNTLSSTGTGAHVHFEIAWTQMGASMAIRGLALRSWRPFSSAGLVTISAVHLETTTGAAVTTASGSLLRAAPGGSGWGSAVLPVVTDILPTGFDTWPIVIPLSAPFQYTAGSNLHIWFTFSGSVPSYVVDGAADGDQSGQAEYGMAIGGDPLVATPVFSLGTCPILGLIPEPPTTLPTVGPKLVCHGEPWVGASLDWQLTQVPANATIAFFFGIWKAGSGTLQGNSNCAVHLDPLHNPTSVWGSADSLGHARTSSQVPANPALLHSDIGVQALVVSPALLSNGLRVTIGGGL